MATMKSSYPDGFGGKHTFKASTPTGSLYDAFAHIDKRIFSIVLSGVYQMQHAAKDLSVIGENWVRLLISRPGSYKPYYKRGVQRMSSAPGAPPAAQKGEDLEPSIYSRTVSKANQNPAIAEFGSTAPFAPKLEFGTTDMPARPFILPARQKVAAVAQSHVARHLQIAYTRASRKQKANTFVVNLEA